MPIKNRKITVIDQTIREGMQYKGLVFSFQQRKEIIDFQEKLGLDICQAGYPSAHFSESENVKLLHEHAMMNNFKIQVAAMGRALYSDVKILVATRVKNFHLHMHIHNEVKRTELETLFKQLSQIKNYIKKNVPSSSISIAMLDIGKTRSDLLIQCADFLGNDLGIETLSLPDTSGIMAPNEIDKKIRPVGQILEKSHTKISIHCHNDMGMASANTIMGVHAGAKAVETSVLGIGERNGIADLYTTAAILKKQGFDINTHTEDIDTFKEYYHYINQIVMNQANEQLLNYNTPFFGDAVKTHVAGTHALTSYGISDKEDFFVNLLCGKHLIKKYLIANQIKYNEKQVEKILIAIKNKSAKLNKSLKKSEIALIVSSISQE